MTFSILTYNIHKGFSSNNREFVLHKIRDQLREIDVDVALLQEVQGEHQWHSKRIRNWPDTSQFEFLADQVWEHYAYGKNAIADGKHHGNAILSKHPFAAWGNLNLSPYSFASRSLLHGNIVHADSGKRIHIICLHLGLLGSERRIQLAKLNTHLTQVIPEHDAVIVGGDFNDWSSKQVSRYLDPNLGMEEIFLHTNQRFARTFPARWPLFCMDRIYYRGLTPASCESLNGKHWRELSDHIPLLARFTLSGT